MNETEQTQAHDIPVPAEAETKPEVQDAAPDIDVKDEIDLPDEVPAEEHVEAAPHPQHIASTYVPPTPPKTAAQVAAQEPGKPGPHWNRTADGVGWLPDPQYTGPIPGLRP